MITIIGVRFKSVGKVYYFDPQDKNVKQGDKVIVETARGVECGEVVVVDRQIDETKFTNPIKPIIRLATDDDGEHITLETPSGKKINAVLRKFSAEDRAYIQSQLDANR